MSDELTAEECLREADAICKELRGRVRYEKHGRYDPSRGETIPFYKVFRRGMGLVAKPGTPEKLLEYLRKQRPSRGS